MSVSRNTAYNLVGAIIPIGLSLVTVPAYLSLVGIDRYGVLAVAWLLLGYFGLFDLGLGRATAFRVAGLKDGSTAERAAIFKTALVVNAGIGLIGGALLWIAAYWYFGHFSAASPELRGEAVAALPWLAASLPVATMTGVLTGALQGRERFRDTNVVSVISTVLFQLLPLAVAYWIGPEIPGLLAAAIVARLAAILVLWRICHREFGRSDSGVDRDSVKSLLSFGGWVTLNGLMVPMLIMADRFLIGAVLGPRAVAIYTIPFQLAQRSGLVPTALSTALFPRMAGSSPEVRRTTLDKSVRLLAAALSLPVFVGVFLFKPFLTLWVGKELAEAGWMIGAVSLVGFWANAVTAIYYSFYQSDGRPAVVTKILAVQVIPYLLLLWVLLAEWGLIAAAWLFLLRAFANAVPLFFLHRPSRSTIGFYAFATPVLLASLWLGPFVMSASPVAVVASAALAAGLGVLSLRVALQDFPALGAKLIGRKG